MADMLKDKRSTRGLRMSSLVGKAADEDDAFWKHEVCISYSIMYFNFNNINDNNNRHGLKKVVMMIHFLKKK